MKKKVYFLLLLCMAMTMSISAQKLPTKEFAHPQRVRYDNECFTIENKDIFIFSAAFHYFRCPEELWADRFRKIKEAGFNTVETYIPWNWHERNMPKDVNDFSQCNFDDLKRWLKMAHEEFGLYTIVRPGPFICAEWAGGAYPRWLAKHCPKTYNASFWLRSDDPEHIKWSRHWYKAVTRALAPEQLSRKKKGDKGIIMLQLENEYIYFGMSDRQKLHFLAELYDECKKNDIDVPLFTCVTPPVRGSHDPIIGQLFDMDNQYIWWNMDQAKTRIENLRKIQPNAPAFVCELQGGWFSTVGGRLSEDSYLDHRHARGMALMAMAGGSTGLNYYMFFGGTHFAGWGARRMTTSYDYGAPLKENGGIGKKYQAVKDLGRLINKYERDFTRNTQLKVKPNQQEKGIITSVSKSKRGRYLVYILNKRKEDYKGTLTFKVTEKRNLTVNIDQLESLDSRLFIFSSRGRLLDQTHSEYPEVKRVKNLPQPIRLSKAKVKNESFDSKFQALKSEISLPELGVNDCRYVAYQSTFNLTQNELQHYGSVICELYTGDPVFIKVNGKLAKRASKDILNNKFIATSLLKEGKNTITVLYENQGHAHGYKPMEELSGVKAIGLGEMITEEEPIITWEVKSVRKGGEISQVLRSSDGWEKLKLNQETIDGLATLQIAGLAKPKWPAAFILQGKSGMALYKTTLHFDQAKIASAKSILHFECIDDEGTLYVNGKKVGSHHNWDKPYVVDIAKYLKEGDNEIAMLVKNASGAGGLTNAVRLTQALSIKRKLNLSVALQLSGIDKGYTSADFTPQDWKEIKLESQDSIPRKGNNIQPKGNHDDLLTWYEVTFDLPKAKKGEWIPWRAVINASGNGYLWLNGHNIGRHWEVGPQREFYLPECWLNFGGTNRIVMGLRQSELNGALLHAIEIRPYENDTEMR